MVNVLIFQALFSFCSNIKCWFSELDSQSPCKNSKQGRPWSDCSFRSSLLRVCTVCLGLFDRQHLLIFFLCQNIFIPKPSPNIDYFSACSTLFLGLLYLMACISVRISLFRSPLLSTTLTLFCTFNTFRRPSTTV